MKLLTRTEFREGVFARDNSRCVIPFCSKDSVDAHHIIERKLWKDEGYYLDNGASLCEEHHKLAEINKILPITLREYIGADTILPSQLNSLEEHNKWGEILLTKKHNNNKYPSTSYLPFSYIPSEHTRDIADIKILNCPVIITTKMDGSNVKITRMFVAARNGLYADHKSFDLLKAFHSNIKDKIPEHLEIFGEWLYAKHSIGYNNLSNYLQLFAVYNKNTNMWEGWDTVVKYSLILNCVTVKVLHKETYTKDYKFVNSITKIADDIIKQGHEGVVVRNIFPFHQSKFQENVIKFVRSNHVQTNQHWSSQILVKNKLE